MTIKAEAINEKLNRGLRGRKADDYFGQYNDGDNKIVFGLSSEETILATIELSKKDAKRIAEILLETCDEMP